MAPVPDPEDLNGVVADAVAAAVGIAPAELDLGERFSRYGLDSLAASGLIRVLSQRLGRPLPPTLVWDHPTTARLIRFLSGAADPAADPGAMRPMAEDDPVAIVAVACRLPGAADPEAYWRLLVDGVDAVGEMPRSRWDVDALYDPDPAAPGRMATRWGGYLDRVDGFDPLFFGMSPREAVEADPQQRLILELVWESLERAGMPPSRLQGSRTGIFMGAMWSEYGQIAGGLEAIAQHSATGRDTGIIANRVSYVLGLTGPSLTVNTACSSSLVAVHLAAQSLRSGESTLAVAGGVNLILTPDSTVAMTKFGAMAPDGRSKAFDSRADGYVRGEGAGVVVLKPLSRAIADGDRVLALLRGSAVNNDGPSNGLTAPSPDAQRGVLRDAYAAAKLPPAEVDYVEAHGTGTMLGDPIEAGSLGAVLGTAEGRERPLVVGSAKTNIGHLEAAAGAAGLIKTVLALGHRTVPPSLHYLSPNPHIDFPALNLRVPTAPEPWPATGHPRRAGVSSFGFGGTNSHAVLEEWRAEPVQPPTPGASSRRLVFVYSGNGAQWAGMGRDLLASEPAFRAAVEACDAAFATLTDDWRVLDLLAAEAAQARLSETVVAQCLMFAVQVGLTRLLESWGYRPDAVVGHSLGEVAAAQAAGVLGLADAARVVFHRSRLQAEAAGQGAMALVHLPWGEAEAALAGHPAVCIAGANAPAAVTVAGPTEAVAAASEALAARGVTVQPIRVDVAYHSPAMDPLQPRLVEALDGLVPRPGSVPVHSTVTAGPLDGTGFDAGYWGRNLREPVRFAEAVAGLPDAAVFVEVSPHPVLSGAVEQGLAALGRPGPAVPLLRRAEPAADCLRAALDRLAEAGIAPGEPPSDRPLHVLTLTAKTPAALAELAARYAEALPDALALTDLANACFTANTGRDPFDERAAVLAPDAKTMRLHLSALARGEVPAGVRRGAVKSGRKPAVALRIGDGPLPAGLDDLARLAPPFADAPAAAGPAAAIGRLLADWGVPFADKADTDDVLVVAIGGDDGDIRIGAGDAWAEVLGALASLFVAGVPVDWRAVDRGLPRRRVLLPTYPFLRKSYWPVPLRDAVPEWAYEIAWEPRVGELPDPAALVAGLPSTPPPAGLGTALDRLAGAYAARALQGSATPADAPPFRDRQLAALRALAAGAGDAEPAVLAAEIGAAWPHASAELAVIRAVGEALPGILAGTVDPVGLLFPGGSMERLEAVYQRSPFAAGLAERLRAAFAAIADGRPGLRVVEIGGGTGGTSAHLLPLLPAGGAYLFTDVSQAFLDRARQRFGDAPGLATGLLDIEHDPAAQGIGADHDVAVAVNALHATADLRASLAHARATLRPGGLLLLGEVTGAPGWLDLVFGTLEGWWRFADGDLRPTSALLDADRWRTLLAASGFESVEVVSDGDRQSLIVARAAAHRLTLAPGDPVPETGAWDETALETSGDPAAACRALEPLVAEPRFGRLSIAGLPGDPATAAGRAYGLSALLTDPARWGGEAGRTARLRPLPVPAGDGPPVRSDGVYLIAGGLGALGLAFAEWLVQRGARHLALLGRRQPNADALSRTEALEAAGAEVLTAAADVTSRADVEAVLADLGDRPLAGVIHAAGTVSDDPAEALAPKLDGARILDALTRRDGVDLFLLFSSAAGTWGANGRAAYAAANAAMDTVAVARRSAGYPALSVAWGRFTVRGLLDEAEDKALAEMGLRAMVPATAFDLARRLAGAERAHVVVADVDWPRFGAVYELHGPSALLSDLPAAEAVPAAPQSNVEPSAGGSAFDTVRSVVAEALGYEPGALPADRGFFDLGLDSLMAVRLRARLEDALGRPVPTAALFAHPTVEALAAWLAPDAPPPSAAAAPAAAIDHAVAVIGIGCRFPGGVTDPESFARLLFDGVDAVTEVPAERWDWREWAADRPDAPGAIASRWGGFLDGVDRFDAAFFGIPPKDAAFMDPQQRLLLETAWEAVERAGLDPGGLSGSRTGVFVGITGSDYAALARRGRPEDLEAQAITGQPTNTAAGRISFTLGLTGPALAVDTACSSSLVALHLACRALRDGECDTALAGGVNLVLAPETSVILSRAGMLSPTGRCHSFDADADGFVRAEGCGMVLLKPLDRALADGDPVLAVVRGSAVNHDGRASGFTVPNGTAQAGVIRAALADAGAAPADVAYVEAHGTGTGLGDPVEAQALAEALAEGRGGPLVVGSVKSNIGHAESAAGIAGFIKTVLALQAGRIPPNLHFGRLNEHIRTDTMGLLVPTAPLEWPAERLRVAGVSAFGASGTNAHVVLEAAPPAEPAATMPALRLVPLSARDPAGLGALGDAVADMLDDGNLADVALSAAASRAGLPVRGFAVGDGTEELRAGLRALEPERAAERPKVAFLFTGQGAQYAGMGRGLYDSEPAFRAVLDRCEAVAAPLLGRSLLAAMFEEKADASIDGTALAQPALFALECGLAALWRSWGVEPAVVLGHSVGEYAAAVAAGVMELDAAMALIVRRGALMQALPAGGGMRAVLAPEAEVTPLLAAEPSLSVAAVNGPANTVVSGPLDALDRLTSALDGAGLSWRKLAVSHAFHSAMLDPMLDEFEAAAGAVAYRPAAIPVISNLTGAPRAEFDAGYWRRHAREAVRFADGLRAAVELGCTVFVELGPQPVLTALAGSVLEEATLVPGLRRDGDDRRLSFEAAGRVWQAGVRLDFAAMLNEPAARRIALPTTPFARKRHWLDWIDTSRAGRPSAPRHVYEIAWEATDPPAVPPGSWRLVGGDAALAAALRAAGLDLRDEPTAGIVWASGLDAGADEVAALCDELQALVAASSVPMHVLTHGAQAVRAEAADPAAAALWGLGRVLALREPARWGGLIDLDPATPPAEQAEAVASALAGEDQTAIRGGRLLVPRLAPAAATLPEPMPVRGDRTYVVTGGLGGLGLALATHLVAAGARHLALVGRSASADKLPAALRDTGAEICMFAADVADEAAMQAVAAAIDAAMPPVAGILHAAGVKDGATADVLAPKLAGASVLDRLSRRWPVELFVLFGSAAAVWGDRDLPAYAAANAALDALAHRRRAEGLPATAVDWARFDVAGMLSEAAAGDFDRLGIRAIPAERAFATMRSLAAAGRPQAVVADVEWDAFRAVYEGRRPRPLLSRLGSATAPTVEPSITAALPPRPAVAARLRTLVAGLLGVEEGEVDPERGFFALGLDSFGVVELRRAVEHEYGLELPTAALFEAPSVVALAARLVPDTMVAAVGEAPATTHEPIAVVGAGLRLPGGVRDLDGLRRLLSDGVDAVVDLPEGRRTGPLAAEPALRQAGWLDAVDRFDADFFGISPREAAQIDPQHRLLLETAWEAVENAGWSPPSLRDTSTGVFVGITGTEYAAMARAAGRADAHAVGGQFLNVAAGRISHTLGLRGPSLAVDTACSSSAMAVHLACKALRGGECEAALAGGVNLILAPETTAILQGARMLSPEARCRTFDAGADGYVRAEGCGLVVLKPLARAEADGDRILAVIRGSAANHDGASGGFTVPSGAAQEAVIRSALADAGVAPAAVSYVEAHGTGTALGDPIEMHALDAVYGDGRDDPLLVGSIKTNIGHAEAAAGIAGLLKVVAGLGARRIPKHLHLQSLNLQIRVSPEHVAVATDETDWRPVDGRRIAGVSAFGASGTNVHLVVEAAPAVEPPHAADGLPLVLPLSARRADDLAAIGEAVLSAADPLAACREAALSRTGLPWRVAVTAADREGLQRALAEATPVRVGTPRIAFLFTGQGSQHPGMAWSLYGREPVFQDAVERCAAAMRGRLPVPLTNLLDGTLPVVATEHAQAALFAVGYGLAALWRSWGVVPEAVLGHSVGEIAAACVAGAMSLEDAAAFIVERGRLMGSLPAGGAMLAVPAPEAAVAGLLGPEVEIAARNGPDSLVLTGGAEAIDAAAARLAAREIECRPLAVSHAFHSARLDPILDALERAAGRIAFRAAAIPVASNLDGQLRTAFDAGYWRRQARRPVAFCDGMAALAELGCDTFVEIGPQPVLCGLGRHCIEGGSWIASLRRGADDVETLRTAVATAWALGAPVDWRAVTGARPRDAAPLPAYPFRETRHWFDDGRLDGGPVRRRWFATKLDSPGLTAPAYADRLGPAEVPGLEDSGGLVHVGLHLAFMAAALDRAEAGATVLADAAFPAALVLEVPRDLQVVRDRDGLTALYSKADDGGWLRHSEMRVGEAAASPSGLLDADAVEARCPDSVAGPEFYRDLEARGFVLGQRLRRIERIRRGTGEVLATVTPPPDDDPRAFGLPATLFEAMAQLPAAAHPAVDEPFMLVGWQRLTLTGVAATASMLLHAVTDPSVDDAALTARIRLADAEGRLLADVEGAVLKRIEAGAWRGPAPAPWLGRVEWEPVAAPAAGACPVRLVATGDGTAALAAGYPGPVDDGAPVVALLVEGSAAAEPEALAKAIAALDGIAAGSRLLLVTRGAMAPAAEICALAEGGGGAWGLAQAIQAEYPALACRLVDLDPGDDLATVLLAEVADDGPETMTAWRAGRRYVARLADLPANAADGPQRLTVGRPGEPDSLGWVPAVVGEPGPDEVAVRVIAAAPNFRDVLTVYGRMPGIAGLGSDAAGVVAAVGEGVAGLAAGDPVVCYVPGGGALADRVVVPARLVRPKPGHLSFAAAAALPVAGLTAWHALVERAGLRAGETVLVHAAGSGVGLAAAAVAAMLGAEVLATASPAKRAALQALGLTVVGSSRDDGFGEAVRAATGGRGVDVAIGAFDDPGRAAAAAALAPEGRLVDLTRRGEPDDVDLDRLACDEPERFGALFDAVMAAVADRRLPPVPFEAVDRTAVAEGFRRLGAGGVVGRLSLMLADEPALEPTGTWLVTGAAGGIGRAVVRHLLDRGVRGFVLIDPAGIADETRAALEGAGAAVVVSTADVADAAAMAGVFAEAAARLPPIEGILHAAAVLDDAPLRELDAGRLARVFRPKVEGARVLDRLSRGLPVRSFVLFSSVVASLPSAGQGAYAAANAALDHVARRRRALGLPARSVRWGPWAIGIGAALGERSRAVWRSWGVEPLTAEQGMEVLDAVLGGTGDLIALCVDWRRYAARIEAVPPLLARLMPQVGTAVPPEVPTPPSDATAVSAADLPQSIHAIVAEAAASVLGLRSAGDLDPQRTFSEQGLDSLMATDLAGALSQRLGQRLPGTLVYNFPTPESLARHLVERLKPIGEELPGANVPSSGSSDGKGDGVTVTLLDRLDAQLASIDRLLGDEP